MKEIALEKGQWEQAALLSKQYELLKDSIEQGKNAESIRNVQGSIHITKSNRIYGRHGFTPLNRSPFILYYNGLPVFINSSPTAFHPLQARTKKPVTTVKSQ